MPRKLIPHQENSSFTTNGYDRCNSHYIAIAVQRDIHIIFRYFRLFAFFLTPLIICGTERIYLLASQSSNKWTRTPNPDGPAPLRNTSPAKPVRIHGPEHIYLVFWVIIFDELWAFTDIDIPVNMVCGQPKIYLYNISIHIIIIYSYCNSIKIS